MSASRDRVLIVGGGVIGLSVAWELSVRGFQVTIIDKNRFGRKASWAGAGILSPTSLVSKNPVDQLMAHGSDLHAVWHKRLIEATGIDNGYRECGGVYIARTPGERASLAGQMLYWTEHNIAFEKIENVDQSSWSSFEWHDSTMVVRVPGESQIRNPDHLKALIRACANHKVRMLELACDLKIDVHEQRIAKLECNGESLEFDQVCFCAGAWSQKICEQIDVHLPMIPVRGQMLMFKLPQSLFNEIVNEGSRYIVPRDDGHVLVGSTTEEVGFVESTTVGKLAELQEFATSVVPALAPDILVASWAGLRPASHDGFPFIGRLANVQNVWVAAGHFKAGLQMSPSTAMMICDLMQSREPVMDPMPFDPLRLSKSRDFVAPISDSETH